MSATVLIVDDDSMFRVLLKRVLTRDPNIDVVGEARDGEEAIQLVRKLRPDVVLMDIKMPGLNGLEAMRRSKAERPVTKVIVLTIHDEGPFHSAAVAGGADAFLPKKTLTTALPSTIQQVIARD